MRIQLISWNLNDQSPERFLSLLNKTTLEGRYISKLLHLFSPVRRNEADSNLSEALVPDLIVVGFQEYDLRPSSYVGPDTQRQDIWCSILKQALEATGSHHFELVAKDIYTSFAVFIYKRIGIEERIKVGDVRFQSVGTGPLFIANKGALSASVLVKFIPPPEESTDNQVKVLKLCFVNSHFSAHAHALKRRRTDFTSVATRTIFQKPVEQGTSRKVEELPSTIWNHDLIFWFGDLNYRIDESQMTRESIFKLLLDNKPEDQYKQFEGFDQLSLEISGGKAFQGFQEGKITFPPTFKYDIGSIDRFDSSRKARAPAWCDRILWTRTAKGAHISRVECEIYFSCMDAIESDHKPVSASFSIKTNIGKESEQGQVEQNLHRTFTIDPNYWLKKSIGHASGVFIFYLLFQPIFLTAFITASMALLYFATKSQQ